MIKITCKNKNWKMSLRNILMIQVEANFHQILAIRNQIKKLQMYGQPQLLPDNIKTGQLKIQQI